MREMKQYILATLFLLLRLISSPGQGISVDTYCIKLKNPSEAKHFTGVSLDSIQTGMADSYEERLIDLGKLLSRFNEEPLMNSNRTSLDQ